MRNNNPFYVEKALDDIDDEVRNATPLKNRTLLVEVFIDKQAESLLKVNLLGSHFVHVERHTSLNLCRGFATTDILDGTSKEEIQRRLAYQFVSKADKEEGWQTIPSWNPVSYLQSFYHTKPSTCQI